MEEHFLLFVKNVCVCVRMCVHMGVFVCVYPKEHTNYNIYTHKHMSTHAHIHIFNFSLTMKSILTLFVIAWIVNFLMGEKK